MISHFKVNTRIHHHTIHTSAVVQSSMLVAVLPSSFREFLWIDSVLSCGGFFLRVYGVTLQFCGLHLPQA